MILDILSRMNKLPFLRSLDIEPTKACNLRCEICPAVQAGILKENSHMSFITFRKIIDESRFLNRISFALFGEPMLNPNLQDFIDYADERGIKVSIATNGLLFTDENASILEHIKTLHLSFDYNHATNFSSIDDYFRIMRGKIRIMKRYMTPTISYGVYEKSIPFMKKFFDEYKRNGISEIHLYSCIFYSEGYSNMHLHGSFRMMAEAKKNVEYARSIGLEVADIFSDHPYENKCFRPWTMMVVDASGDAYSCCNLYHNDVADEEFYCGQGVKYQHNSCLGNVNEQNVMSIWNSEKMIKTRKFVRRLNSMRKRSLSPEQFKKIREHTDFSHYPNYCMMCTQRWRCIC